ncbi:MAG: 5-formyltetrahydrofolate cyclo-ligase [Pseudomonadales bacterium]
MTDDYYPHQAFSSSPCYAHEFESLSMEVDPHDKQQVSQWRKQERQRLLRLRMQEFDSIEPCAKRVISELSSLIEPYPGLVISAYWPMRGEFDLRDWFYQLIDQKMRVALPAVESRFQPLIFREWTPNTKMEPGVWNISVPAEGERLTPDIVIAPVVGFDAECFRLGYGGGYFDRTLAQLPDKPLVIGVGPAFSRVATIYPQAHDIPMDMIVTGSGDPYYRNK